MPQQTIAQLQALLPLLQQPAFCLGREGVPVCNPAGQPLAPADKNALPQWLGSAESLYDAWDRQGPLTLSVTLAGQPYQVCAQPLEDGTLFLLSRDDGVQRPDRVMATAAQVLKGPLSDLFVLSNRLFEQLEELEDPMVAAQTSAMMRQLYRLVRISNNLADWQLLQSGGWPFRPVKQELQSLLAPLLEELTFHCGDLDRPLQVVLPKKPLRLHVDESLLTRALYNLFSNALKYGVPGTPIQLRLEASPRTVFFQVRNQCSPEHMDLLTAAFRRMEERGLLPDPQWGVGLGLPICQQIAALHGGAVALELLDGQTAAVTMSFRRRTDVVTEVTMESTPIFVSNGLRTSLVELSDSLPAASYDSTVL